jgi:hypothetical protein
MGGEIPYVYFFFPTSGRRGDINVKNGYVLELENKTWLVHIHMRGEMEQLFAILSCPENHSSLQRWKVSQHLHVQMLPCADELCMLVNIYTSLSSFQEIAVK